MLKSFEEISKQGFDFEYFEKLRKQLLKKFKLRVIIVILINIFTVFLIFYKHGKFYLLVLGVVVFMSSLAYLYYHYLDKFAVIKDAIFNNFLNRIDSSFGYTKDVREFYKHCIKSIILPGGDLRTEDIFFGKINGLDFMFGEAKTTTEINHQRKIVFQGVVYIVKTPNNYDYLCILRSDNKEIEYNGDYTDMLLIYMSKAFENYSLSRLWQKRLKIEENEKFNSHFKVWTKNEQMANEILTPKVIKFMLENIDVPVAVSFLRQYFYVAVNNKKNLYKINFQKPITEAIIKQFYDDFVEHYQLLEKYVNNILYE